MTNSEHSPFVKAHELGVKLATVAISYSSQESEVIDLAIRTALLTLSERVKSFRNAKRVGKDFLMARDNPMLELTGILVNYLGTFYEGVKLIKPDDPRSGGQYYVNPQQVYNELTDLTDGKRCYKTPTLRALKLSPKRIRYGEAQEPNIFKFPQTPNSFFQFLNMGEDGNVTVMPVSLVYTHEGIVDELAILKGDEEKLPRYPMYKAHRFLYFFDQRFSLKKIREITNQEFKTFKLFELETAVKKYNEERRNRFQYQLCKFFLAGLIEGSKARLKKSSKS